MVAPRNTTCNVQPPFEHRSGTPWPARKLSEACGLPEFEDFFQSFGDIVHLGFSGAPDALMKTLLGDGANLIQDGDARLSVALDGDRQGRRGARRGRIGNDNGGETRIVQCVGGDYQAGPGFLDFAAARWVKLDPPDVAASNGCGFRARQSSFRFLSLVRFRCRATHQVLVPEGEYPGTR